MGSYSQEQPESIFLKMSIVFLSVYMGPICLGIMMIIISGWMRYNKKTYVVPRTNTQSPSNISEDGQMEEDLLLYYEFYHLLPSSSSLLLTLGI